MDAQYDDRILLSFDHPAVSEGIGQLLSAATVAAEGLTTTAARYDDLVIEQFGRAFAIRMRIGSDPDALQRFREDAFWENKKAPSSNKLALACVVFCYRYGEDRKVASRLACALEWLLQEGIAPNGVRDALKAQGGISGCAKKFAAWRREQKRKHTVEDGQLAIDLQPTTPQSRAPSARCVGVEAPHMGSSVDLLAFASKHSMNFQLDARVMHQFKLGAASSRLLGGKPRSIIVQVTFARDVASFSAVDSRDGDGAPRDAG